MMPGINFEDKSSIIDKCSLKPSETARADDGYRLRARSSYQVKVSKMALVSNSRLLRYEYSFRYKVSKWISARSVHLHLHRHRFACLR